MIVITQTYLTYPFVPYNFRVPAGKFALISKSFTPTVAHFFYPA
jgi:hypothetical protein